MNDYDTREMSSAYARSREIERAPLKDRREARESFTRALRDPKLIAERVGWLLDGNYGRGEQLLLHNNLEHTRNPAAVAVQQVAVFEWQCPVKFAVDAWKKLSPAEKKALDKAVLREIADWKKGE